ncbi:hypothetical protein [Actinomadura sp. HBU206391]|uniref:hypothetical protein n=1 Tax=Actinomadura sp. HBU206391 TaxID=2731692 RepID=UPI0016503FB0|nr:hypothetical protein [Actinomadura sp. HBU206391]MBC6458165.1 hypothetical protein [Actinomadura sp. HBU206391]
MAKTLTADSAARLTRRATLRRADGSRGPGARWAWRRLVRACADGDPAAQDEVRAKAAELPETDVLDLLAMAPDEPADRAAYLALIGQDAQRQALDPDGTLLALAYRAVAQDVRERLRTTLATTADTDVIRVVVTGDQRDRIAEMTHDELDYLARHLADHHRWDELRHLTLDLPVAEAAATARLLPERERLGDSAAPLAAFAERSPAELRSTVDRLPHDRLTMSWPQSAWIRGSFSPDSSELAVICAIWAKRRSCDVATARIGTGTWTHHYSGEYSPLGLNDSILHLGTEVIIRLYRAIGRYDVIRIRPDHQTLCSQSDLSYMRRAGRGAVLLYPDGLAYADPGATGLRYEPFARFGHEHACEAVRTGDSALTTLPGSGLVAFVCPNALHVVNENQKGTIRTATWGERYASDDRHGPALSFRSPDSLALTYLAHSQGWTSYTEMWTFPPQCGPYRAAEHEGAITDRWPLGGWMSPHTDHSFAAVLISDLSGKLDKDLPWLRGAAAPDLPGGPAHRRFLALSPWGDMLATSTSTAMGTVCEVHSPHLPSARGLLERPLLHSGPQDLRRVLELRPKIGDPAARDALDLLATCLAERFGGEIALAGGTGPIPAGGTTDIALGEDRTE